ncbi:MAG: hypothetical protein JSV09_16950 [Thermoplasmata archaeon]|nr:MAG: hypothetical protein JSV09_16950 [Thermoplasmata archaeon]
MYKLPQYGNSDVKRYGNDTKLLAAITIFVFLIFAMNIIRLWLVYLPQMEEAGRETQMLISEEGAGGAIQIIQHEIIPEIRFALILSLIIFGLMDGIFIFMLWKGNPRFEHRDLILPLFTIYIIKRIFHGIFISMITIIAIVGSNPRSLIYSLYMTIPVFFLAGAVIMLLFHTKIFGTRKRKATKILFKASDKATL